MKTSKEDTLYGRVRLITLIDGDCSANPKYLAQKRRISRRLSCSRTPCPWNGARTSNAPNLSIAAGQETTIFVKSTGRDILREWRAL